jgi:hypothetical protein
MPLLDRFKAKMAQEFTRSGTARGAGPHRRAGCRNFLASRRMWRSPASPARIRIARVAVKIGQFAPDHSHPGA